MNVFKVGTMTLQIKGSPAIHTTSAMDPPPNISPKFSLRNMGTYSRLLPPRRLTFFCASSTDERSTEERVVNR